MIAYRMKFLGGAISPGLRIGLLSQSSRDPEVYPPDDDDFPNPTDELYPRAMWEQRPRPRCS